MASVMALEGETSFLRLKDVTNTRKCMRHSPTIGVRLLSAKAESLKKLKTSNVFPSFIAC